MTRVHWLSALVACCVAAPATLAEHIIHLGTRPTWIRLEITIDGQTLDERFQAHLKARFEHLDQNKDGQLSADELKRMTTRRELKQQMQQIGASFALARREQVDLAEVDSNSDGSVSLQEFIAYYRADPLDQIVLTPAPLSNPYHSILSDELLAKLDTDRNGKLSKTELAQAPKLIERFDSNDDECVAALELVPDLLQRRTVGGVGAMPAMPGMTGMQKEKGKDGLNLPNQTKRVVAPFLRIAPGEKVDRVVNEILYAYNRNDNLTLSREEVGFDEAAFARLDTDADGQLDTVELIRWLEQGKPDVVVRCDLSIIKPRDRVQFVVADSVEGYATVNNDRTIPSLRLGRQSLVVESLFSKLVSSPLRDIDSGATQMARELLRIYDPQKKGFIDLNDPLLRRNLGIRTTLIDADADGDSKVTLDELLAHQLLLGSAQRQMFILAYSQHTLSLFELLDTNRDGRLSRSEFSGAWATLRQTLQVESDELLVRGVGNEYRLSVGLRMQQYSGFAYDPVDQVSRVKLRPTQGPVWFAAMDRNGDGDVSRREFLGMPEDFDRIDTNRDGVISREEAEQFERARASVNPRE